MALLEISLSRGMGLRRIFAGIFLLLLSASAAFACGNCTSTDPWSCFQSDRWPVKTLADSDAALINMAPVMYTIPGMQAILRPAAADNNRDPDHRLFPEFTVFQIIAALKWATLAADGDLHMAIVDPNDSAKTMVIELPDPACMTPSMYQATLDLRNKIEAATGVQQPNTTQQYMPPLPIIVTGVAYWDLAHGQADQAPNNLELHPLLDVSFPPPPPPPTSCSAPAARAINICSPAAGSTLTSPAHVLASATGTTITNAAVSLDGTQVFSVKASTVDTYVNMTPGAHRITVTVKDSAGYYWRTVYLTAQ